MRIGEKGGRKRLVLSPQEPLVAGGPAEDLEERIQDLLRHGFRHFVIDLRGVPDLDASGLRALVRGYTSAQRLGGSFRLVGPTLAVRSTLGQARLDNVFEVHSSLEEAQARQWPWDTIATVSVGAALFLLLVWVSVRWSHLLTSPELPPALGIPGVPEARGGAQLTVHPFMELFKLVFAGLIGILVTAVHKHYHRDKPLTRSLEQAQVLLCVSGALMMIIIGNSIARAFGIAGAASIIRFRTPVEDPKDTTILFLLVALGMSCGVGALAVAGLGTVFLIIFLAVLNRIGREKPRTMFISLLSDAREFPTAHVQSVFARYRILFEPREISQGKEAAVKYHVTLNPETSLEDLSSQLMGDGSTGIKSVAWKVEKD